MYINRHKKGFRLLFQILFTLYLLALIYFLFFAEMLGRTGMSDCMRFNMIPFHEIRRFVVYHSQLGWRAVCMNLIGNVLIFVPYGFLLPVMHRRNRKICKVVLLSFVLSLVVESLQLISRAGSFDVDDIILNTLGGFLGYLLYSVIQKHRDASADRIRMAQKQQES